jgi:glycosyltransferase involved in cell wall biosynthesis
MSHKFNRVCIVCHGPLSSNSGRHVSSLAKELQSIGWSTVICVPSIDYSEETSLEGVAIYTFQDFLDSPNRFDCDLYHYWTPREVIRSFHVALCRESKDDSIKYVIHFEDDESILLRDQIKLPDAIEHCQIDAFSNIQIPPHLTHPVFGRHFAEKASGLTALTSTLLEDFALKSKAVFWPGYDDHFEEIAANDSLEAARRELDIPRDNYIITYIGNLHCSNLEEVRSLYIAVALVNRMGLPLTLIRTGHDSVPLSSHGVKLLKENVRELGHVPKARLPVFLQLADILIQPGRDDTWNRKRVPSKLPEFLVSGRPVVLPRANLGVILRDGKDAIVLEHATAASITETLLKFLPEPALRAEIGSGGRLFALEHLQWKKAANSVDRLYKQILHNEH